MSIIRISTHFTNLEAACKCGCGQMILDQELLIRLEYARIQAATPFRILSWNRCERQNKLVKGSHHSAHLYGHAVDIATPSKEKQFHVLFHLLLAGFKRIGIGNQYIHADCDPDKRPEKIWFY